MEVFHGLKIHYTTLERQTGYNTHSSNPSKSNPKSKILLIVSIQSQDESRKLKKRMITKLYLKEKKMNIQKL